MTPKSANKARCVKVSPSILASNFARLGEEITSLDEAGADMIHIDVMDGHFVPNLTFGPPVIKALRGYTSRPFDVHLMISNPFEHIKAYADAGADVITVHAEAYPHLDKMLDYIRSLGKKAGVSLNPSTPPEVLEYVIEKIDLVLIMTVNPGFGGQEFISAQLNKIKKMRQMIGSRDIEIEVDGGINDRTAALCVEAGADILVAGNYIFSGSNSSEDYAGKIDSLKGV